MEIYLCHMVFFRVLEKMHLIRVVGNETASYIITVFAVLFMATVFSWIMKRLINTALRKMKISV